MVLHQEAIDVPNADGAVQVWLFEEQLTLSDGLFGVLCVCPTQTDKAERLVPDLQHLLHARSWHRHLSCRTAFAIATWHVCVCVCV